MNVVIHDLGTDFDALLEKRFDVVLSANGAYAPCQGCFHCWTKHPAECSLKDSLHTVCRTVGQADNLTIISRSRYGTYVPAVKKHP